MSFLCQTHTFKYDISDKYDLYDILEGMDNGERKVKTRFKNCESW